MHAESIPELIERYEIENAGIVGAVAALLPGPAGTLSRLPAIALVLRNHVLMIRELALVCGRRDDLTPGLALDLLVSGLFGGGLGVVSNAGRRALIRHGSVRALRSLLRRMAVHVSYGVLKAWLSQLALGVGAGALVLWARSSTRRLAEHALSAFRTAPAHLPALLPARNCGQMHTAP